MAADGIRCAEHLLTINWFRIHLVHLGRTFPRASVTFLAPMSPFLERGPDGQPLVSDRAPTTDAVDESVTFTPDGVFTLKDQENGKTLLFFLEADMGTETLAGSHRGVKDIRKKIINYQLYFRSGGYKRYQDLWGCELSGFRLLFLANTPARLTAQSRLFSPRLQPLRYLHGRWDSYPTGMTFTGTGLAPVGTTDLSRHMWTTTQIQARPSSVVFTPSTLRCRIAAASSPAKSSDSFRRLLKA